MLAFLSSICLLFLLFPLPSSAHRPIINGSRKHLDNDPCKLPTGCNTIPAEPNPTRLTVYHSQGHKQPAIDTLEMTDGSREEVHLGTGYFETDNYVVTIGLGTPPREMTVVMDTGSAITWVQCPPCTRTTCHAQRNDIFNPNLSSTYQTFNCDSTLCKQLPSPSCTADDGPCTYQTTYMDNSSSSGQFVSDRLTLNAVRTIENFLFGCGHDQKSSYFGQTSGLLGLGPPTTSPSLLNQAAGTSIGANFAYCLPRAGSTGYLEFGAGAADEGSSYATLTSTDGGYFVELLAVEVNGVERLSSSKKTMVDTGTVLTRLPVDLYTAIKALVERAAGKTLVPVPGQDHISDCYEIVANGTKELPPINVTFKLGGGARLVLDEASVFYRDRLTNSRCLTFVRKDDDEDPVLGNALQSTYRWSFDMGNHRIAITPKAC